MPTPILQTLQHRGKVAHGRLHPLTMHVLAAFLQGADRLRLPSHGTQRMVAASGRAIALTTKGILLQRSPQRAHARGRALCTDSLALVAPRSGAQRAKANSRYASPSARMALETAGVVASALPGPAGMYLIQLAKIKLIWSATTPAGRLAASGSRA